MCRQLAGSGHLTTPSIRPPFSGARYTKAAASMTMQASAPGELLRAPWCNGQARLTLRRRLDGKVCRTARNVRLRPSPFACRPSALGHATECRDCSESSADAGLQRTGQWRKPSVARTPTDRLTTTSLIGVTDTVDGEVVVGRRPPPSSIVHRADVLRPRPSPTA